MNGIRRFLEWHLELPRADAGEGSQWRLQLDSPFAAAGVSGWVMLLLLCGLGLALHWRGLSGVRGSRKVWLSVLRLATLVAVLSCLMRLTLVVDRTSLPALAILIDRSASMARADVMAVGGDRTLGRLPAVQDWLCQTGGSPLEALGRTYRVRLFEFATELQELSGPAEGDWESVRERVRDLRADGGSTRLASALESVLEEFRGAPPAAVIVLSDGVSSEGPLQSLSAAAGGARDMAAPVWTVGVGSAQASPDLELADVRFDRVALVGDAVMFDVRLETSGTTGGTADVRLLAADGEVLDGQIASLPANGGSASSTLRHQPDEEGRIEYILEALPLPGEINVDNNRRRVSVDVRGKKLRVLYVERLPRWEFRHLKAVLERDESLDLQTVLLDSDLEYTREDRTALPQPPASAADVLSYDVVILGDVTPSQLPRGFLESVVSLVGEGAGGLIVIAGDGAPAAAMAGSPLERLLPVSGTASEADFEWSSWPVTVLPAGRVHPLLRLEASGAASEGADLPPLTWAAAVAGVKPGASVLAEVGVSGEPPLPVLVTQRFGRGQVLWHGTDELWKWRRLREDALYGRYWSQAVRWVSRGRLAGPPGVELRTDRRVYGPADPIRLRLSLGEERIGSGGGAPELEIMSPIGERRLVVMSESAEQAGDYVAQMTSPGIGGFVAEWRNPPHPDWAVETEFRVEASAGESPNAGIDEADLRRTAEMTRGRYRPWSEAASLPDELPPGRPAVSGRTASAPLWSRWEAAALVCGLMCLEWFVRRRSRLV
ncbi:MAG: VWA domain-containing protein [Planctomyces sp.]|nr:VWA domain-containing protein [Planctomyces sp.]